MTHNVQRWTYKLSSTCAMAEECVGEKRVVEKRGRARERRGRDGGHGVDKAVLFLIYVLL